MSAMARIIWARRRGVCIAGAVYSMRLRPVI
jgi:hypothetical protein